MRVMKLLVLALFLAGFISPMEAAEPAPDGWVKSAREFLKSPEARAEVNALAEDVEAYALLDPAALRVINDFPGNALLRGWPVEKEAQITPLLDQAAPSFAAIERAAGKTLMKDLPLTEPYMTAPMPDHRVTALAKLLILRGLRSESQGRIAEASKDFRNTFLYGLRQSGPESPLLRRLISFAIERYALDQIERLLARSDITPEECGAWKGFLAPHLHDPAPIRKAFEIEGRGLRWIINHPAEAIELQPAGDERFADRLRRIRPGDPESLRELDQIWGILLEICDSPYAPDENTKLANVISSLPKDSVVRWGTPNIGEAKVRWLRILAAIRLNYLNAALRQARKRAGEWPPSLEDLKTDNRLPLDPFTGNPFRYEMPAKDADAAAFPLLYSLGPDASDQSGSITYDPTNGTASPGDIIARSAGGME